jgi:hypothetical protein
MIDRTSSDYWKLDSMSLPPDELQLYAEYGIAAEKAQVLEVEAGNVALAFIAIFVDTDRITAEDREMFRGIVDDVNRKTLGALLKSIRTWAHFDEALINIIDDALDRRNYLAHRFFPNHNFAIFSTEGRQKMIEELKVIQGTLDSAHGALSAVSSALIKFGGRADTSNEIAKKHMAKGKRIGI